MKKQVFAFAWFLCLLQINTSSIFAAPVINEFSSADSSDWIEIYNSGTETVDLSLYRIRDLTANNKLDLSGSVPPSGFAAFDWSNKLNNAGDLIKLVLTSDESIADQVAYGDQGGLAAPGSNQTGGRQADGGTSWVVFTSSSKNASNNSSSVFSPPTATPTNTPTPTKIPTPTKTLTPTKSPTPTKIPTVAKASPGDAKTPTPKISSIANPSAYSTKIANSAKISTYSKSASQFATIKSLGEDKEKEREVKVLGTKDSKFPFVPILIGIVLLTVAGGWFVFKNLEQIKIWIKK